MSDIISPTGPLPKIDIGELNIGNLFEKSQLNNTIPSKDGQALPFAPKSSNLVSQGYSSREATEPIRGYDSFKNSPSYNKDYSQFENQRQFAANQGGGEFARNLGVKFLDTTWNAFTNNFKQYDRDFNALMNWDSRLLVDEVDNKGQKDLDNKYPTLGSGENQDSWVRYLPFHSGSGDFYGSVVPSLGFTAGTLAATLGENAVLAATTGGVGNFIEGVNSTRKVGAAIENLYKTFTGIKSFERGLKILNNVTKEAGVVDKIITGTKGLANFYQMYHTAASEASFEGSTTYEETKQKGIDDFVKEKGYSPFGKDLKDIEEASRKAKVATFVENLPVLLASNFIQFNNILKPYSLVDDIAKDIKIGTVADEFKFITGSKALKTKTLDNIWKFTKGAGKVLKGFASEGSEEIAQGGIQAFNKAYYSAQLQGKNAKSVAFDALGEYSFSKNFWDDFLGGGVGGLLFQGAEHLHSSLSGKSKAEKENLQNSLTSLNSDTPFNVVKEAFDLDKSNLTFQDSNNKDLNKAFEEENIFAYKDAQDNSFRSFLWNRAKTGKFGLGLEQLNLMRNLEGDDFKKAFGVEYNENEAKVANETIDKLIERANQFEKDYIAVDKTYKNPYNIKSEINKYQAFEGALRDRVFSRDFVERDKQRQESIYKNIDTETKGVVNKTSLSKFFDPKKREDLIKYLTQIQSTFEKATDKSLISNIQEQTEGNLKKKAKELVAKFDEIDPNDKETIREVSELLFDYAETERPFDINNQRTYDRFKVVNDIMDTLSLEMRNRANVENYFNLQTKEGFNKFFDLHFKSVEEVEKNIDQKTSENIKTTKSTDPISSKAELTSLDVEKKAKDLGIEYDRDKRTIKTSSTEKTTYPDEESFFKALDQLNKEKENLNSYPTDPLELSQEDFDNLLKQQEVGDPQFEAARKKPLNTIAYTTTSPVYEERSGDNDILQRFQDFSNNLFYGIGGFKGKKNLVTIPITNFNYKEVGEKLGADLSYIIRQDQGKYALSETNLDGHITFLYGEKEGDNFHLLDKSGNRITKDFENNTVQGRLTELTNNQDIKFRDIATPDQIKVAKANNTAIRKSFLNNSDFQFFDYTISKGIPNGTKYQNKSLKEANIIPEGSNVKTKIFLSTTSNVRKVEGEQLLLKGRPYLEIEGKDANGNPSTYYQYLDNKNLTQSQKDNIKDTIKSLKDVKNQLVSLEEQLRADPKKLKDLRKQLETKQITEFSLEDQVLLNAGELSVEEQAKISSKKDELSKAKTNLLNYLTGVLQVTKYSLKLEGKNNGDHKARFHVLENEKGFYFEVLVPGPDGIFIKRGNREYFESKESQAILDSYLEKRYHNVDKGLLDKPFFEKGKFHKTYSDYLLNSENPPLTVRQSSQAEGNNQLPYIQRYATIKFKNENLVDISTVLDGPKIKIIPKVAVAPVSAPKNAPVTSTSASSKEDSFSNKPGSKEGLSALRAAKAARLAREAAGEDEEIKNFSENVEPEKPKVVPTSTKAVSSDIIPDDPDDPIDMGGVNTDDIDSFRDEDEAPFQIERSFEQDPISQADLDRFKSILSQVDFKFNPELERIFKNRRVWGAYQGNVVNLYKGSGLSTLYHESFEVIFNSILTKGQKKDLIDSFKAREGTFEDFLGNLTNYSEASNNQAKEKLADEFYEWKKGLILEDSPKTFFAKLLKFLKEVFDNIISKSRLLRSLSKPTIENLYRRIDTGYYNGIPLKNSFKEYFQIGELSEYETTEVLKTSTANAFKRIAETAANKDSEKENLFSILEALEEKNDSTNVAKLYDFLKKSSIEYYTQGSEKFKQAWQERVNNLKGQGVDPKTAASTATKEATRARGLFEQQVLPNWDNYIKSHKNFLGSLGIKFESDNSIQDQNDKRELGEDVNQNDYTRDHLTFDGFKSIPAVVKLIIGTLNDSVFQDIKGSFKPVTVISPITMQGTNVNNYTQLFNRLMNNLSGYNNPEALRAKLEFYTNPDLITKDEDLYLRNIKAQFRELFDRIFVRNESELSESEMKIRLKFILSFSKQMPGFKRFKIDTDNNVRFVNELFETSVKQLYNKALSNIRTGYFQDKNKYSWIAWEKGITTIGGDAPEGTSLSNISKYGFGTLIKGLDTLGFKGQTEEKLKVFSSGQLKNLIDQYNEVVNIIGDPARKVSSDKSLTSILKTHIGTRLNNLAETLLENSLDESNPMHLNPKRKAQNNYLDNNFPSLILSEVNNAKSKEEFFERHPYYLDPYLGNSLLLNEILFKEGKKWNLDIISGIDQAEDENKSKTFSETSRPELFISRFNASLQTKSKDAIYPILENADGSIDYGLQVGKYLDLFDRDKIAKTYYGYLQDEVAVALDFIYNKGPRNENEELNKIETYPGLEKRSKGASLQFFNSLLSEDLVKLIHNTLDNLTGLPSSDLQESADILLDYLKITPDKVFENFNLFLYKEYQKDLAYLKRSEHLVETENGYKFYLLDSEIDNNLSYNELDTLLKERNLNYITHNIEMFKLFFGAPYYYSDPMKRFKSFQSPALTTLNDTSGEYNKWMNKYLNVNHERSVISKSDLTYHEFSNEFKFVSVSDIQTVNSKLSKFFSNYEKSDSTDGQMYMTLNSIRELLWKTGASWTKDMERQYLFEKAYERIKLNEKGIYKYKNEMKKEDLDLLAPYKKDGKYNLPTLGNITILKPISRGFKVNGIAEPSLIKTSALPLSWSVVEGTEMEDIYIDMLKNKIHGLTYKSAHKVGQSIKNGQVNSLINEDGTIGIPSEKGAVETVPFWNFSIQVETQSQKDKSKIGTQTLKIATVDTYEGGVPTDFKSKSTDPVERLKEFNKAIKKGEATKLSSLYGKDIRHTKALRNLFDDKYENFLKRFGVKEVRNPDGTISFNFKNTDKFKNVIEQSLIRQDVPEHIINQLRFKDQEESEKFDLKREIPLSMMSEYSTIKYIIYSMIDKRILSPKLNGGQKIQFSSLLLDKAKGEGYKLVKDKKGKVYVSDPGLKIYSPSPNGTSRMQVKLSSRIFSDINKKRENKGLEKLTQEELITYMKDNAKELLEGIGFRIPTQALSAIDAFEIVGFLPEYLGDTIAVPSELPTKAGSDFDVDKLNTYLNNYHVNKQGYPEYIRFFENPQTTRDFYKREFRNNIQKDINRLSNSKKQYFRKTFVDAVNALKNSEEFDRDISEVASDKLLDFLDRFSDKIYSILDDFESYEDAIQGMLDHIEEIGDKVEELTEKKADDVLAEIYADKFVSKAIENEYFSSLGDIILDPSRFNKLISPNSAKEFTNEDGTGYSEKVQKLKSGISQSKVYDPSKMLSFSEMVRLRNIFTESKRLVGIGAVGITSHSNFQRSLNFIQPLIKEDFIHTEEADYIKFKHNQIEIQGQKRAALSSITKVTGENIAEFLSKYVDGAVDNVKKTWLVDFGAYGDAYAVAVLAEKVGMDTEDISILLNHPLVVEYQRIKALKQSPVYSVNPSIQEKYGSLWRADDYYNYFRELTSAENFTEEFTSSDLKILKSQIAKAGENSDFNLYSDSLETSEERNLGLSVLKQFLLLSETSSDLRQVNDSSNHETVHFSSNVIMPLKDSKLRKTQDSSIRAFDGNKIVSSAQSIRDTTFIGAIVKNLKKTEKFIYENVTSTQERDLVNYVIEDLSLEDTKEVSKDEAEETLKRLTSLMYTGVTQSAKSPFDGELIKDKIKDFFKIDSEVYKFLNSQIERYEKTSDINKKIQLGLTIFDYLEIRPSFEDNGTWFFFLKNKPTSSDLFGTKIFNEAFINMKDNNPELYENLAIGTILQSGVDQNRNNFTSFIQAEDYFKFSELTRDIRITPEFLDSINTLYAQNNFRRTNGIVTKMTSGDKIAKAQYLSLTGKNEGGFNDNTFGKENPKEIALNSNFALVFPQRSPLNLPTGRLKANGKAEFAFTGKFYFNRFVQRKFISYTTGKGDNAEHHLLKRIGSFQQKTNEPTSDEMITFLVFQEIPLKGTLNHKEYWFGEDMNSEFPNKKLNNPSVDLISRALEDMGKEFEPLKLKSFKEYSDEVFYSEDLNSEENDLPLDENEALNQLGFKEGPCE